MLALTRRLGLQVLEEVAAPRWRCGCRALVGVCPVSWPMQDKAGFAELRVVLFAAASLEKT